VIKIHDFNPHPCGTSPAQPLILGSDGNYYGCSSNAVFRIDANGLATPLHQFVGQEEAFPTGLIEGSDGNYYGTTNDVIRPGTIFKITSTGVLTTLHVFNGDDGGAPYHAMVFGTDGNLYGTTIAGGANGSGTIFKITPSGNFTLLHSFDPATEGGSPEGLVLGSDHNFYGVTQTGNGSLANGTVFRFTRTGVLQTLHVLDGAGDGAGPASTLIQARDGNYYGTAEYKAGSADAGCVFRISAGGTYVTIHSFTGSDGINPVGALLIGADGALYGTTMTGGVNGCGVLYKISLTGTFNLVHSFTAVEGAMPSASLIIGADGNFYGTSYSGGPYEFGAIFRSTLAGAVTTINGFTGPDGYAPSGGLLRLADGSLYGTTSGGGLNNVGSIYKLATDGTVTTLHSLSRAEGAGLGAPLTPGADGDLYGLTTLGGTFNQGTAFKLDTNGTLTLLHSFDSTKEGDFPGGGLLLASDGNFYGVTPNAAPLGGSVYKMTPAGVVSTVYSFIPSRSLVRSELIEANGVLYGEDSGDTSILYPGSVYSVTPDGTFATAHDFTTTDGSYPLGPMAMDADGSIFGITEFGGAADYGTVFKLSPGGQFVSLHQFSGTDGAHPNGGLAAGTDGAIYGVTRMGGTLDHGEVFKIDSSGAYSTVCPITPTGIAPDSPLTQGADGNLYGTSSAGGAYSAGAIYEVLLNPPPIKYDAGLNFFSLPYDNPSTALDTVLGYSGVKLAVWDPTAFTYDVTPTAPADHVRLGTGYWARFPAAISVSASGTQADTATDFVINLKAGWNAVGDPFLVGQPVASLKFEGGTLTFDQATTGTTPLIGAQVWGYDPAAHAYVGASTIAPGQGYWIYATQDTNMTVPHP